MFRYSKMLILFAFLVVKDVRGTRKLQVIALECETFNKEVVKDLNCSLKIVDRVIRLINVDLFLPTEVQRIFVNLTLKLKTARGFQHFPLNSTEDLCEFLYGKREQQKVLSVLLDSVRPSFYNVKCPTQGHLGIKDADVQLQEFGLVPSGIYRFDLIFFFDKMQPGFIVKGTAKYDNLVLFKV